MFCCSRDGAFNRVGSWLFEGSALILRNTNYPSLRHFKIANGNPKPERETTDCNSSAIGF